MSQPFFAPVPTETDRLAKEVVDAAFRVHSTLGPGLLESTYEHCLAYELGRREIGHQRQAAMPVRYGDLLLDAGYRVDLIVADQIIVELKAVDVILPVHQAQILTYLRLSGCRVGFLMNFNVSKLKDGVKRFVL